VVAILDENGVTGASVGDSEAWLVEPATHVALTEHQARKPLIGTGQAIPTSFASGRLAATLLVGTDGLFKYSSAARIRHIATQVDLDSVPDALIASALLRSGALQDDATVIACRL
jgi:serine/threonine protein phosphatase PrpC